MVSSPLAARWQTYQRLLRYLLPYWWAVLLVIAGFALNAATEMMVAKLMQFIIDAINQQRREYMNLFPVLIVLLFVLLSQPFQTLKTKASKYYAYHR